MSLIVYLKQEKMEYWQKNAVETATEVARICHTLHRANFEQRSVDLEELLQNATYEIYEGVFVYLLEKNTHFLCDYILEVYDLWKTKFDVQTAFATYNSKINWLIGELIIGDFITCKGTKTVLGLVDRGAIDIDFSFRGQYLLHFVTAPFQAEALLKRGAPFRKDRRGLTPVDYARFLEHDGAELLEMYQRYGY